MAVDEQIKVTCSTAEANKANNTLLSVCPVVLLGHCSRKKKSQYQTSFLLFNLTLAGLFLRPHHVCLKLQRFYSRVTHVGRMHSFLSLRFLSLLCPLFNDSHFLLSCCHHVEARELPSVASFRFSFSQFAAHWSRHEQGALKMKVPSVGHRVWLNARETRAQGDGGLMDVRRDGKKERGEKGAISHRFQRQRVIKHPTPPPPLPPVLGKPAECKQELAAYAPAVNKAGRMHGSPLVERRSPPSTPPTHLHLRSVSLLLSADTFS